jgi:hypothetical protein
MINISLSADQTLMIESSGVTLRGVRPVFNSVPFESWICETIRWAGEIELRYKSAVVGEGMFGLRAAQPDAHGHIWIQYWVEGLPGSYWDGIGMAVGVPHSPRSGCSCSCVLPCSG